MQTQTATQVLVAAIHGTLSAGRQTRFSSIVTRCTTAAVLTVFLCCHCPASITGAFTCGDVPAVLVLFLPLVSPPLQETETATEYVHAYCDVWKQVTMNGCAWMHAIACACL